MHKIRTLKDKTSKLAASEFILNKRGAIYHLDLLPEEIGETIITVGDPGRVKKVSQYFDSVDIKKHHREFKTHTGYLDKKKITVISTGIGTDNIDIVMNELDALVNIDFKKRTVKKTLTTLDFIRIGTSGALQEDIEVDRFVANTGAVGLEGLAFYYGEKAYGQTIINQDYYYAEATESLFGKVAHGLDTGVALTAAGFYAPQGRCLRLDSPFRNGIDDIRSKTFPAGRVTNMEMETAGIYYLANKLGHHAISLNAILANRITGDFSSNPAETIDRLIRKVIQELRMN